MHILRYQYTLYLSYKLQSRYKEIIVLLMKITVTNWKLAKAKKID